VLDAGITSAVPFRGVDFSSVLHVVGQQKRVVGNARFVDPAYFSVMQIPLVRGRLFSDRDTVTSGKVTVLSESYARQMFGNDNALGKQIDNDGPVEVVGLVRDARYVALDKEPAPSIYFPAAQFPNELVCLVARTLPNAGDLGPAVRRIVHDLDPALPAMNVTTIDRIINESVGQRRFYTMATSAFAALALLLTIVGLVVVVARSVVERRRELAIRAALGATAPRLVQSVVGQGLVPVLMGTAAGLGSAYVGATLLAQFLFQVTPREPTIYAAAAVVIVAVAALASFVPARRVTSVAPADVMRAE
jgi:hypothetical protein